MNKSRFIALSFVLAISGFGSAYAQAPALAAGTYKLAIGAKAPCDLTITADGAVSPAADCATRRDPGQVGPGRLGLSAHLGLRRNLCVLKPHGESLEGLTSPISARSSSATKRSFILLRWEKGRIPSAALFLLRAGRRILRHDGSRSPRARHLDARPRLPRRRSRARRAPRAACDAGHRRLHGGGDRLRPSVRLHGAAGRRLSHGDACRRAGARGRAYWLARRHARDTRFTFGSGKFGDLAAFASAIVLGLIALGVAFESVERLVAPVAVNYGNALGIATLGLLVNLLSAFILKEDGHAHDHGHAHGHDHAQDHR